MGREFGQTVFPHKSSDFLGDASGMPRNSISVDAWKDKGVLFAEWVIHPFIAFEQFRHNGQDRNRSDAVFRLGCINNSSARFGLGNISPHIYCQVVIVNIPPL